MFAENGQQAVTLFQTRAFDLVLMDMQMPIMDGLSATRAIRTYEREQEQAHVPILALTANALPSDRQASEDAGCNGHLTKPISKGQLLAAIHQYQD